jgi:chemotaxis protein MotB
MAGKGGKAGGRNAGVTIIRREEVVAGGHHGGAWKVAYADFVTAMMAFFLLMWLLNATTEDQRKGLADYFSPNSLLSHSSSGTGQPFGGHTAFDEGALVSDRGSVEITEGKRPSIEAIDDSEAQSFSKVHKPAVDKPIVPADQRPDPALSDTSAAVQARRRQKSTRKRSARKRPRLKKPRAKSARRCAATRRWPNSRSNWRST